MPSITEPIYKQLIQSAWGELLQVELASDYMQDLGRFLQHRRQSGVQVYPPVTQVFSAFAHTPPEKTRVVILGQDPYHNPGQAQGMSFAVGPWLAIPPSLRNIYTELQDDTGFCIPAHGCLDAWAAQGVLLLNSVLTVERNRPGAHQGKGWERFTDRVVELLSEGDAPLVFMLWGAHAQRKGRAIDARKHCVLSASHPSPLSAYRGFFGCRHFSKANAFLQARGLPPIDWSLPEQAAA